MTMTVKKHCALCGKSIAERLVKKGYYNCAGCLRMKMSFGYLCVYGDSRDNQFYDTVQRDVKSFSQ